MACKYSFNPQVQLPTLKVQRLDVQRFPLTWFVANVAMYFEYISEKGVDIVGLRQQS